MSSPSLATNGASLTNCHTNVFALTELNGLQWKRFGVSPGSSLNRELTGEGLQDPVLVSYGKCLSASLLTAWKRTGPAHHFPPVSVVPHILPASAKKLWVFWYGDEPDLSNLLDPELIEEEIGSWDTSLPYECRVLLFRALHTLIERCLLSQKYVRLGRWFVQPNEFPSSPDEEHYRYSYAFEFFLHGDSTVCTTVDVRLHPQLVRLNKSHISQCAQQTSANQKLPVVLCPYGLSGTLTGRSIPPDRCRDLLAQWKQFFPLEIPDPSTSRSTNCYSPRDSSSLNMSVLTPNCNPSPGNDISAPSPANPDTPNPSLAASSPEKGRDGSGGGSVGPACFVEVLVGGARMWYLSTFVLVLDDEKLANWSKGGSGKEGAGVIPPLVPAPVTPDEGRTCSQGSWNMRKSRYSRWILAAKRSGMNGLPACRERNEQIGVNKVLRTSLEDFGKEALVEKGRSGVPDSMVASIRPLLLNVPELVDPNDKKPCECEVCRPVSDQPAARSTSPVSSPPSYQAQGLALMALLAKAKEQQPTASDNRLQKSAPFHKRLSYPPTPSSSADQPLSVTNRRTLPPMANGEPLSNKPVGRRHQGLFSPGVPYPKTPVTPQVNSVGSLVPTSPVSSPSSSVIGSVPSPVTPATPFNPRTPKTPRSIPPPRSMLPQPSPIPVPANPTPPVSSPEKYVSPNEVVEKERLSLKRPLLSMLVGSEEEDADHFGIGDFGKQGLDPDWYRLNPKRQKTSQNKAEQVSQDPVKVLGIPGIPSVAPREFSKDILPVSVMKPATKLGDLLNRTEDLTRLPGKIGPLELARMFPTPPSLESQPACSPVEGHYQHEGPPVIPEPEVQIIEKENITISISSAKYAPVRDLPSLQAPPIEKIMYRPVWLIQPRFQHISRRTLQQSRAPSVTRANSSVKSPRSVGIFSPGEPAMRPPMPPPILNRMRSMMEGQPGMPVMGGMMPSPSGTNLLPECQGLLFNILMGDSIMNFFADKNFGGCSICVCNMSIRGASGYGGGQMGMEENQFKCSCGFSSVVNRRFSFKSGIFAEDETEISGYPEHVAHRRRYPLSVLLELPPSEQSTYSVLNNCPASLIALVKHQTTNPFLACSPFALGDCIPSSLPTGRRVPDLQQGQFDLHFIDMTRVCSGVLELCRGTMTGVGVMPQTPPVLHRWLVCGVVLDNSDDVMKACHIIQPTLQDAVQLRRQTRLWDKVFTVEGPLTWRDFLRFADKEVMEEQKEPLPIPKWVMGLEKERVHVAPSVWPHWEMLGLEPYGNKRDVVYMVLAPDNDHVIQSARTFFRELSRCYEMCGLGRHLAMPNLSNGITVVSRNDSRNYTSDKMDDWFQCLGESPVANELRLYRSTCRSSLGPHIAMQVADRHIAALFRPPSPPPLRILPEGPPSSSPSTIDLTLPATPAQTAGVAAHVINLTLPNYPFDPGYPERDDVHPLIVLYLLDPFATGVRHIGMQGLTSMGLLRSYQEMAKELPESVRESLVLQLVPVRELVNWEPDQLRALALSVYSQNRRKLPDYSPAKMLTGFGPATGFRKFLDDRKNGMGMAEKKNREVTAFVPPYVLRGRNERDKGMENGNGDKESGRELHFAYCLSEDQRWLLVTCTDARGEMIESQIINIWVSDRTRQKGWSVTRYSLLKLWDFIFTIIVQQTCPCRLIIGRVGRLSHGELKVWSSLLSKKSLSKIGQAIRQTCLQCKITPNLEMPNILSACLISLQSEGTLRVLADAFSHDERLPSSAISCPLSGPEEASCTHLYVFPTSATAQAQSLNAPVDDHNLVGDDIDLLNIDAGDFPEGDGDDLFKDLFNFNDAGTGSPQGSPRGGEGPHRSLSPSVAKDHAMAIKGGESLEEPGQLLQQPLAVSYLVSTASTGPMPRWFFTATDQDEHACPVVLMSALHIHSANVLQGDDVYHAGGHSRNTHPLDSNLTAQVLKHVMESYNTLSWLVMDPVSRDRRSCLPHHIQVLMQLYFASTTIL